MKSLKAQSRLVHEGRPSGAGAPLNVPLVPASNFLLGEGSVYSREHGVPTWQALEDIMGALEEGTAIAFSSGMAAVAAVFEQLPVNATVVIPDDCYQGVARLAEDGQDRGRWTLEKLPTYDTEAWIAAGTSADLLWVESPSNPMLVLADLPAIAQAPRKPGGLLVVDNTFATPLNQQPLVLGADISLHSATKFIGGHSDLLGGILVAGKPELADALRSSRQLGGATPGVLESFLATRGLRTLAVRLERAEHNAQGLAEFLERHPAVSRVSYPGLPSHPQHEMAKAQLGGFGGIVTLELAGGADFADAVCGATRLIRNATSLGSVETTIERRAVYAGQEHLPPSLLRISVGIEALEDLQQDLETALAVEY